MKHAKFEGFRIVPNVSMTLKEIDYFTDIMERLLKTGAVT